MFNRLKINWTRYWTVGHKIAAGFLLGMSITFSVGIVGFAGVQTLDNSLRDLGRVQSPRSAALEDLNSLRLQAQLTLAEAMLTQNKADYVERLQNIRAVREDIFSQIDGRWTAIEAMRFSSEESNHLFETLKNEYEFWRVAHNSMLDRYIRLLTTLPPGDALDNVFTEFVAVQEKTEPVSHIFGSALEQLRKNNAELMERIVAENSNLSFETKFRVIVFMLLGIVIAIMLTIVVTNLITVPARDALELLTAMSRGRRIEPIARESNDEIGQMIRLLQTEIAEKLKAEDFSRSKVEFLAMLSHEIRTPLNAILGLTEVQLQTHSVHNAALREDTAEAFKTIKESGRGLLSIVNRVLDISKIEMGKLEFNPRDYDLAALVDDVVHPYRPLAAVRQLEFIVRVEDAVPARLHGDADRIKQILDMLLSNAFKFTESGFVKFEAASFRMGAGIFAVFTVSDSGIGIKESDIPFVFTDFRQVDSGADRKSDGLGLGLAISQRLATLMGG
ncbi:MAG: MCP four helix bundle domain-containing protein, partial [Spirochaetaceae bacterium]|nr:MCP four helix bundle domain-containing protein [Spirochaetaceae bacterium]